MWLRASTICKNRRQASSSEMPSSTNSFKLWRSTNSIWMQSPRKRGWSRIRRSSRSKQTAKLYSIARHYDGRVGLERWLLWRFWCRSALFWDGPFSLRRSSNQSCYELLWLTQKLLFRAIQVPLNLLSIECLLFSSLKPGNNQDQENRCATAAVM